MPLLNHAQTSLFEEIFSAVHSSFNSKCQKIYILNSPAKITQNTPAKLLVKKITKLSQELVTPTFMKNAQTVMKETPG